MNKKAKMWLAAAICLLAVFSAWTVALRLVDVQAIGPGDSEIGFAQLNRIFHKWTGVHMVLYHITDWLGLVPVGVGLGFALLGMIQWIRRKHILRVDYSILVLGGFYLAVMAVYILFEKIPVNYRPVLIDGVLEVSYPSSTTMLVMCVMPTAVMQCKERIQNAAVRRCVNTLLIAFAGFMVAGRLICGVHWLTDIIGGALVSGALVALYAFAAGMKIENRV